MNLLLLNEAVTLAHSARLAVLARGLAEGGHRVTAAGVAPIARFAHPGVEWRELDCIGSDRFVRALARGSVAYSEADLRRYVDAERQLIAELAPDAVLADFRPTVSISARLAGVPCAAIVNAYWSPLARDPLPMPVLPFTRWLPLTVAQALFDAGSRWVLPLHARPWNRVRQKYGLPDLGPDLRRIYSDADVVLYPDIPGMFDLGTLPAHHHFIGPLLWSPPVPLPPWWADLPAGRPLAYVNLGSSGDPALLQCIVAGLRSTGMTVAATADTVTAARYRGLKDVFIADLLPGDLASARADLVVCNGGAMTCHQAFACGKPVLGIAGNMDQFMNMAGSVRAGAGLMLRADRVTVRAVASSARALLQTAAYAAASGALGQFAQTLRPAEIIEGVVRSFDAREDSGCAATGSVCGFAAAPATRVA
jgi:UDP:flavonoid glycosyltransferase YjiC (YdhE family)